MSLSEVLDKENLPKPPKGLRFVKNEEGIREFKSVEISENTDKEPERWIVLVGHIGAWRIERIQTEILHILQEHDEIKGPIVIIAWDAPSSLANLWLQLSDEQMKELGKIKDFIITKREEITDTFILPQTKLPDFKQRKSFHQNYSPKTNYKKGQWYQRTKQRKK